jgi:hypothetical protein
MKKKFYQTDAFKYGDGVGILMGTLLYRFVIDVFFNK